MTHRVPEFLQNKDLQLILFGGKGGVGKTTMAAASALHLARSRGQDKKVFVISTDPAHSLSDSFRLEIGDRVTGIDCSPTSKVSPSRRLIRAGGQGPRSEDEDLSEPVAHPSRRPKSGVQGPESEGKGEKTLDFGHRTLDAPNLFARELDASRLLDDFKQKNDGLIKKLAERGTYFDQEDIAAFFDLSLPGMDEVMAIIELANLLKERTYDLLIVDTAPTGHTVRMLNLPGQMQKWIEVLDLMQQKHRYMSKVFSGKRYRKDACDIFLDDLAADIERVKKLLSDRETTRFVPVMIPEPMSINETERLIRSLEKSDIPVKEMIVNNVAESDGCAFCRSKKEDQKRPLMDIEDLFSKYDLIKVPLFPNEIRGAGGLNRMAECLSGTSLPLSPLKTIQTIEAPGPCLELDPGLEFVLFGGKGGVGKTTLASAAALYLAWHNPGKKVLLFSTDPAHSLSDSLDQPIGEEITAVQLAVGRGQREGGRGKRQENASSKIQNPKSKIEGLFALEIDADRLWRDFKEAFKSDITALFDRFLARGADIKFDREVMTEMLEFAPPGLDEIMSLDTIMDLKKEGAFDIFVLDTSPTGHLLRFLELPDLVREWLKAFFRLLLKYKGVVRLTGAAEKALALSRNVRGIQETLTDPERVDFVAVTIAEAMGVLELERLVDALETGKIPCGHIIVNKVVPETDCGFCSVRRAEQQDYIRRICSRYPERTIAQAPLLSHQVQGISDLNELSAMVFCEA